MSLNVHSSLLDQVTPDEFYLLSRLANRINKDRTCFPGTNKLMKECGWSKSKLQRIKKSLYAKGLLSAQTRKNESAFTSNLYKIETPLISKYNGISTGEPTSVMGEPTYVHGGTYPISTGNTTPISTSEPGVGSELGHKVLSTEGIEQPEVVSIEGLNKEDRYLSYCIHSIFENLIFCIFPQFEDYRHCGYFNTKSDNDLDEVKDPTVKRSLEKILDAARKIYSAFEALQRPLPAWRETAGFPGTSEGEINPVLEAKDQIRGYADFCRLTKTFITTDPEKLPEKLITVDWCKKLLDYLKPLIEKEQFDPAYHEHELHSSWLIELYYYQSVDVWVCTRYNNRIVYCGEEYLKVK